MKRGSSWIQPSRLNLDSKKGMCNLNISLEILIQLYSLLFHINYYPLLNACMLAHWNLFCRSQDQLFQVQLGRFLRLKTTLAMSNVSNTAKKIDEAFFPHYQSSLATPTYPSLLLKVIPTRTTMMTSVGLLLLVERSQESSEGINCVFACNTRTSKTMSCTLFRGGLDST